MRRRWFLLAVAVALAACDLDPAEPPGDKLCGNGVIDPGEDCDTKDGATVFTVSSCHVGQLVCLPDCTLDDKACKAFCGDEERNGDEECDGTDFKLECTKGSFSCRTDCTVDETGCQAWCGDGVVTPPEEQCEPAVPLPSGTCYDGQVSCLADCTIDYLQCNSYCGDETINGAEECDGTAFHTDPPCHDSSGAPLCRTDCTFDPGTCTAYCGDGKKNGPEECDGADYPLKPCAAATCEADCTTNDSLCP